MTTKSTHHRNLILANLVCEMIDESPKNVSNHQVVLSPDRSRRLGIVSTVKHMLTSSPTLSQRFHPVEVDGPVGSTPRLADLWLAVLESPDVDAAQRPQALPRTNRDSLFAMVARVAADKRRRLVLIIDDLEAWAVALAGHDEEWSLRWVMQNEPLIVVAGHAAVWSADVDPGRALYHGLRVRRAR